MSAFAMWLNEAFAGFDHAVLELFHNLAVLADWFFTPFFKIITLFGEDGIPCIILGIALLFFKKTRKAGVCVLAAIIIGWLVVNISVKPLVARPRPYVSGVEDYYNWWLSAGGPEMSEFSFPSGHTNIVAATLTAFCFVMGKKWIAPCAVFSVLMGMSRIYLMVHYPTDVIGGLICGFAAGLLGWLIVDLVYKKVVPKFKRA
ncbi:MAG: phosphatase PAP2 family protein [Oscillospiraceae bacterium]|nr:phosphatase PAP2 family protein [Oscillospiraceae bacterium]